MRTNQNGAELNRVSENVTHEERPPSPPIIHTHIEVTNVEVWFGVLGLRDDLAMVSIEPLANDPVMIQTLSCLVPQGGRRFLETLLSSSMQIHLDINRVGTWLYVALDRHQHLPHSVLT